MPETCKGCKFYRSLDPYCAHGCHEDGADRCDYCIENEEGFCVRYPPVQASSLRSHPSSSCPDNPRGETRYTTENYSTSPKVYPGGYCGEFTEAEKEVR